MKKLDLSIIIPCYNEEKNLPLLVKRLESSKPKDINFELRLVDNGSTDGTRKAILQLTKKHKYISITKVEKNQGYGWGIISGLKEAKGEFVAWTHADFQTDILDTIKAYRIAQECSNPNKAFVKGIRHGRPIVDRAFSLGNSFIASAILGKTIVELNAQPNLFHRSLLKDTNPPKDWGIEIYFYYVAKKRNYEIKRFPVLFTNRLHGKSNWNTGMKAKINYIKRAVTYTAKLRKEKIK